MRRFATLTFTPDNWASPQTVAVSGGVDMVAGGDKPFTIAVDPCVTTDAAFMDVDPDDVSGINFDDATPGIHASPIAGPATTEAGGTATFTIELQSHASTSVAIDLVSSDTTEGTVSPAMATLDSTNWNVPQLITVTGVDDSLHVCPAQRVVAALHHRDGPERLAARCPTTVASSCGTRSSVSSRGTTSPTRAAVSVLQFLTTAIGLASQRWRRTSCTRPGTR